MWQEPLSVDAAGRAWPRPDLRAGDHDRKQVVAELQRHYVEGRLTADELGERVAHANAARTFGELAATLADLPPTHEQLARHQPWYRGSVFGVPITLVLGILAIVAMLALLVVPTTMHAGFMPLWPLFIWGFFFIGGRPGRRPR